MRSMVEGHGPMALILKRLESGTCPSTTFGGPPPPVGEDQ